jgi:multiple sugar transport system substrate-binding protein
MKRKLVSLFVALVLLVSVAPAFAATEIEFAFWMSEQQDQIFAMVDKFNESQDEVHVNPNLISSGYWDKMGVSVPAGEGSDVFCINALHTVDYVANGYVLDISDLFENGDIDLGNFAPSTYMTATLNGKTWGIPKDYDTIAIAYNKDIFDQAGLEYPKDGWTWDEFVETCKTITEKTGIYAVVCADGMQNGGYLTFASGGSDFDENGVCVLDSEEVIGAYQAMADLIWEYKVAPTIEELQEVDTTTMFLNDMVAMTFQGSWNVRYFSENMGDKIGFVSLPIYNDTEANIVHSVSFVGNAKTKEPEAVKKFLAYLATEEAQAITATTVIPAYNGLADVWAENFPNLNLDCYTKPVPDGTAVPLPCAPKNSAEIYTAMCNMIKECEQFNTVAETCAQYTAQINDLLK